VIGHVLAEAGRPPVDDIGGGDEQNRQALRGLLLVLADQLRPGPTA
jgi:hypothetical protein